MSTQITNEMAKKNLKEFNWTDAQLLGDGSENASKSTKKM